MENGNMNEKICLAPGTGSGIGKVTAKAPAAGGALKKILYPSSAGFHFFKGPDSVSISSRMNPGDRPPTAALGHS